MTRTMAQFHNSFWLPSLQVLNDIERRGIHLDQEYCDRQRVVCSEHEREQFATCDRWATDYIRQVGDFNWNSVPQLQQFLYDYKCYPVPPVVGTLSAVKPNKKEERSTSEAALTWIQRNVDPEIGKLLKARKTRKLGQFLEKLPGHCTAGSRISCSLKPTTDTGRLTCSNPNLQQIPTRSDTYRIRKAFTAASGKLLIVADYSQLEMFVLAHWLQEVCDDDSLWNELRSGDAHTRTAAAVWPGQFEGVDLDRVKSDDTLGKLRSHAKTANYSGIYGKSDKGLAAQLGISLAEAQALLNANPVGPFRAWAEKFADEHGYVPTLLGRTRPLTGLRSDQPWERSAALRKATNTPIQGSAADIVTTAMLRCNTNPANSLKRYGWYSAELAALGCHMVLQIHDELIFEVPEENACEALPIVVRLMEQPFKQPLKVDLKIEAHVARNWNEGK